MRNIVNAIFLSSAGILLARRSPSKKAYPNLWSFPGGHVEDQETLEQALTREITEELGVDAEDFSFLTRLSDPNFIASPVVYHMFLVTRWTGVPQIVNDEHTDLRWFTIDDAQNLNDLVFQEYRHIFEMVQQKLPCTATKSNRD
jgi:8-oxo-dGTP diphosphatase